MLDACLSPAMSGRTRERLGLNPISLPTTRSKDEMSGGRGARTRTGSQGLKNRLQSPLLSPDSREFLNMNLVQIKRARHGFIERVEGRARTEGAGVRGADEERRLTTVSPKQDFPAKACGRGSGLVKDSQEANSTTHRESQVRGNGSQRQSLTPEYHSANKWLS